MFAFVTLLGVIPGILNTFSNLFIVVLHNIVMHNNIFTVPMYTMLYILLIITLYKKLIDCTHVESAATYVKELRRRTQKYLAMVASLPAKFSMWDSDFSDCHRFPDHSFFDINLVV